MVYKFCLLLIVSVTQAAVVPVAPAASLFQVSPAAPVLAKFEEFDAAPQYSFAYDVQDALTGDSKAQYETRNGDIVQGSYSLIEADGTRRIVDYTADPINGFNAIVSREPAVALASPVVSPIAPLGLSPVPLSPAFPVSAPEPVVPASGPDSDVEVIDARSGPLRAAPQEPSNQLRRISQPEPFARINKRPTSAQTSAPSPDQEARQSSAPLRALASRVRPAQAEQKAGLVENHNAFQRQQSSQRVSAVAAPVSYTAYAGAYTSPLAFTAPVAGLTYTAHNL